MALYNIKYNAILTKTIQTEISSQFWKFVQNNPDIPWDWDELSLNPNVTYDIVQNNPDKPWDWCEISHNKFYKDAQRITLDVISKWLMCNRIKRWYKCVAYYDVTYKKARDKLYHECELCEKIDLQIIWSVHH